MEGLMPDSGQCAVSMKAVFLRLPPDGIYVNVCAFGSRAVPNKGFFPAKLSLYYEKAKVAAETRH